VTGVSVKATALGISAASTAANIVAIGTGGNTLNTAGSVLGFTFASASNVTLNQATANTSAISITIAGNVNVTLSAGTYEFAYGGETLSVFVGSGDAVLSAGKLTKLSVFISASAAICKVDTTAHCIYMAHALKYTFRNNSIAIRRLWASLDNCLFCILEMNRINRPIALPPPSN